MPVFGAAVKQRTSSDPLGFARPFIPTSPRPDTRLRAERIGGWTSQATCQRPQTTRTFPDLADQARISDVIQDSDFRTKSHRGKNRIFPPSLRASGARRETSQLHTSFTSSAKYLTSLNIMAYPKKTPAVQFHVDCTPEAKSRFATLHEAFGFKTKAATFEAVLFAVSIKDKIDPQILLRLETKLDRVLENFDNL